MFGVQLAEILGAKVKRGAKMLVIFRRGSCTCMLMWFGAGRSPHVSVISAGVISTSMVSSSPYELPGC